MFYYANAVLSASGYKVGERIVHKVTADALIVFIRKKLKESMIEDYEETKEEALNLAGLRAYQIIESFDFEISKRSLIQYKTVEIEKHSKAETSLQRAKEFAREMNIGGLKCQFKKKLLRIARETNYLVFWTMY